MANRYFTQFFYSFFRKPTMLAGEATFQAAVAASAVIQDLTYTADAAGVAGNSITIAYTDGATAGSEVVTVLGNAISVQIESGVSTATQVKAAVDASVAAAALVNVTISGVAGNDQTAPVTATNLAGGLDNAWISLDFKGVSSIAVNGAGDYTINLQDKYSKLLSFSAIIESTTNQDRIWQIDSDSVSSSALGIRCLAATTPTHPANASVAHFQIMLENSSV